MFFLPKNSIKPRSGERQDQEATMGVEPEKSYRAAPGAASSTTAPAAKPAKLSKILLGVAQGVLLTLLTPILLIGVVLAPSLFLVYGEKRHLNLYFPGRWPRWLPPMFLATAYRTGGGKQDDGHWGVVVAVRHSDSEMRGNNNPIAARYVRVLVGLMKRCRAAALAGQLPGFVLQSSGKTIPSPFVPGNLGTLYAMRQAALRGAKELNADPRNLIIAVPGGAGRIGEALVELLRQQFRSVIAIDPRYQTEVNDGNVTKTSNPEAVASADLILALTPKGEDLNSLVQHVRQGVLFLDDTHPDIPKSLRVALREKGANLYKPAMTRAGFRWLPLNLPGYRETAIPGCLIEALTVASHGRECLNGFDAFEQAANTMGFEPMLFRHPDVV